MSYPVPVTGFVLICHLHVASDIYTKSLFNRGQLLGKRGGGQDCHVRVIRLTPHLSVFQIELQIEVPSLYVLFW